MSSGEDARSYRRITATLYVDYYHHYPIAENCLFDPIQGMMMMLGWIRGESLNKTDPGILVISSISSDAFINS